MSLFAQFLLKGTIWTILAYGTSQILRLGTNVILARLLSPDVFGTMLIVYTLRTGIELISDVGLSQSVIYNKKGEDPEFYNTAWTLSCIRSLILWLIFIGAAVPMANFYQSQILVYVVPVTAFVVILTGATSISKVIIQKRMQIIKLNVFDLGVAFVGSMASIGFALITPTVWALVYGGLFGTAVQTVASYFLLPNIKQRWRLSRAVVWEILTFGKWIYISSIVFFLSTYIDRFFLPKVVPIELFGVYGIARSISDLSGNLVLRLGNIVLFPFVASHSKMPRAELRNQLGPLRGRFLLITGLGFALFVATADLAIRLLYDQRYHAATWILPVLVLGSWLSVLATINEYALLGVGKPSYAAIGNGLKLAYLAVGLTLASESFGLIGGVVVVSLSDLCRYVPILVGQIRERFSYGKQDLVLTLAMLSLVGFLEWLRWTVGLGTSFDTLPIDLRPVFGLGR